MQHRVGTAQAVIPVSGLQGGMAIAAYGRHEEEPGGANACHGLGIVTGQGRQPHGSQSESGGGLLDALADAGVHARRLYAFEEGKIHRQAVLLGDAAGLLTQRSLQGRNALRVLAADFQVGRYALGDDVERSRA